MNLLKNLTLFIFFILIGEVVFRLDEQLREHKNIIETVNVNTNEKKEKCKKSIFLLGDSYTAGQGIPEGERILDRLKFKDYCIINRTKGGDNWIDYYKKYTLLLKECNRNDVVVIGVNWNDILYGESDFDTLSLNNKCKINNFTKRKKSLVSGINQPPSKKKKIWFRRLYSNSKLANTLSSNIQNTLKRHNLALPIGDFHYLNKIGYSSKKSDLDYFLYKIDSINSSYQISAIFYLMPEFNLLKNSQYFDNYINYYKNRKLKTIQIINGFDDFKNNSGQEYMISIHDGHPNSSAHAIIAKSIKTRLNSSKSY